MKHWLNTHYKSLIIFAFLIPIMTVALVSISHVTKWYGISNPFSWSIYLSIGIEIAALSALAAISADMGSKVYFPFAIVTLVQFIGNIFFAYSFIDINSQSFKDWVDLVSPLVSFMGVESTDLVGHKRFLAFFAGGMLPIISLSFLHMLVKFTEEDRKKEEVTTQQKPVIDEKIIEEAIENYKKSQESKPEELKDFVDDNVRIKLSDEDLKKLEEVLLNPPAPNEKLKEAAKKYEEILKGASLKEEWATNDESIVERIEEFNSKNELTPEMTETMNEVQSKTFSQEPTTLEEVNDILDNEVKEVINETPTSVEEKTINLRQVVFVPIEEEKPTKEEQREILNQITEWDQELGLYDEPLFPKKVEEAKKIIENSNLEEVLQKYEEEWGGLSNEELIGDDEFFSTITPTIEEEERNFSTNEPNLENILDYNEIEEDYPGQFEDWENETVSEPFATPEELNTPITETLQEVIPTPVVSNEEVEKKNS